MIAGHGKFGLGAEDASAAGASGDSGIGGASAISVVDALAEGPMGVTSSVKLVMRCSSSASFAADAGMTVRRWRLLEGSWASVSSSGSTNRGRFSTKCISLA